MAALEFKQNGEDVKFGKVVIFSTILMKIDEFNMSQCDWIILMKIDEFNMSQCDWTKRGFVPAQGLVPHPVVIWEP